MEILPKKKTQQSLFVLNVYSPPRDHLRDLDTLLREVRKRTKGHKTLVVGDFNAPHVAWGYPATQKKGEDVHNAAMQHHLTLLNEPQVPTRIGNSVTRDTCPDLSTSIKNPEWMCMDENLGSDHYIVQTIIPHHKTPLRIGQAKITDWNAFRSEEKRGNESCGCGRVDQKRLGKSIQAHQNRPTHGRHAGSRPPSSTPMGGAKRADKKVEAAKVQPKA